MPTASLVPRWRKLIKLLLPTTERTTELPGEYRERKRHPASLTTILHWTAPSPGTSRVKIRNVSLEGLRVEMPMAVEVPQLVRLSGEDSEYTGWILYCKEDGPKFVGGIHLVDPELSELVPVRPL